MMLCSFFIAMKTDIIIEEATCKGRSDVILKLNDRIYIIELKIDGAPDNAIRQIKDKHYHEKYLGKNKEIHLLVIDFSTELRNIESYKEEIL